MENIGKTVDRIGAPLQCNEIVSGCPPPLDRNDPAESGFLSIGISYDTRPLTIEIVFDALELVVDVNATKGRC